MISIITFSLIALAIFIISYFWLETTYEITTKSNNPPFIFSGISEFFYFSIILFCIPLMYYVNFSDFISGFQRYQIFAPLMFIGILLAYPKRWLAILCCFLIAAVAPTEAINLYFPQTNIYLQRFIIFAFLIIFSYTHEKQNTFSGISFLQLTTLGAVFFGAYLLNSAPEFFGYGGLILAVVSLCLFIYNKMPSKLFSSSSDNMFFGLFTASLIVFASAEYLLIPCTVVFSMFLINTLYSLFQKIINFNFKKNFDIYYLALTQEKIDEADIYSFSIKAYIFIAIFALSPIKMTDPKSAIIASTVLSVWFLNRTLNLYQEKSSWKTIYKDIKEKVGQQKDDK